ncbi:MAG: nuclease-related domain-containing protein [Microcoleaceae cyanobacterium]
MTSSKCQFAGEFVRAMSFQYRRRGVWHYFRATGVIIGLVLMFPALKLSRVGLLIYGGCLVAAYSLLREGQRSMQRADNALAGARAEGEVAALVHLLVVQGWHVEHNFILKWGDADVVLQSPLGNSFVIDVKSHRGTIILDGDYLKRRMGDGTYDFQEGNLINKVKGQAVETKRLKQLGWVTALLCFTQAEIQIKEQPIQGVYVVSKQNLIDILRRLDHELTLSNPID